MPLTGTKEISVFVDESGSFDPDESSSRFYLICFVMLVAAKIAEIGMSASESRFFGDRREFLRNILKPIRRKSL